MSVLRIYAMGAVQIGSFVAFDWWSSYSAMSTSIDPVTGKNVWVELQPGDTGLVIGVNNDDILTYMSNVGHTINLHASMLALITC